MLNRDKKRRPLECISAAFIIVTALFMACSLGKIPVKQYYIVKYTPSTSTPATSKRPYNCALHVGRFEVQRIFNRQNIIYRYSPNEIQYYELERWAVRPDYMITDMVFKHLEASKLTNRVSLNFLDTKPDYRIEGNVEALEKFDAGDLFFAHFAMMFKLFRVRDGVQVWNYSFDRRIQVYSKEMVYTVRALSSILQSEMDVVVAQLDLLFLSMETGTSPVVTDGNVILETPLRADSLAVDEDIDESSFEIIREKK